MRYSDDTCSIPLKPSFSQDNDKSLEAYGVTPSSKLMAIRGTASAAQDAAEDRNLKLERLKKAVEAMAVRTNKE